MQQENKVCRHDKSTNGLVRVLWYKFVPIHCTVQQNEYPGTRPTVFVSTQSTSSNTLFLTEI